WGDEKDANAGVYYLDNDNNAKKVTPGVGAVVYINNMTNTANTHVGGAAPKLVVVPSFFSGEIVPNLTAAALAEIDVPLTSGGNVAFAVAGGLKYNLKVNDSVTITPQAGVRFNGNTAATTLNALKQKRYDDNGKFNSDIVGANSDNQLMNVKVGADVSGLINNTTFSVDWTSRNLLRNQGTQADNGQIGTINLTCKISM
ncbi:MAG: hypothetical protein II547_08595, partial [Treponema sp.]|nr:hypothetical protein [Treponema sp.]